MLSAATGAIVALNQTGVIELKKTNPAATQQVGPPPSSNSGVEAASGAMEPAQTVGLPPSPKPAATGEPLAVAAKDSEERLPSAPVTAAQPTTPPPIVAQQPEPKAPSNPSPPLKEVDAERLKAVQEGAAAAVEKPAPNGVRPGPVPVAKSPDPTINSTPALAPVPEQIRPDAPATLPSRTVEVPPSPQPASTLPPSGRVGVPPSEARPPAPPDRAERLADARPGTDTQGPVVDGSGTRVVRPPADVVRAPDSRVGAKRIVDPSDRPPRGSQSVRIPDGSPGRQLDLTGLILAIPSGWVEERVEPGPMAPVAALRIPDPEGDGLVLVSRYLGAKGPELEERAIDRWLGMVSLPEGSRPSRSMARMERIQLGAIRILTLDIAGTVRRSPRDAGEPNHRVMGAIIDHPAGPHLVTITGPARAMSNWEAAMDGFLRSARVE